MTGKIKRRSLRCGGRPKADFGSIFTTFIAPALGVAGSVADSAISKAQASKSNIKPAVKETNTEVTNNNSVENLPTTQAPTKEPISGLVTSNTVIPPDPTKTPTMRLGGRKKCWIGAAIMGATSIAGSLFGAAAQKREMRRQKSIKDWQDTTQEAANMTSALNNSQDYQDDYLRQFRTAARLGKTLGAKGIYITDGGDATKIDNNTYLLRGGSHEDVNETGQTGIGINVGGNEVEAEGGEVAQKKNGALRIFSAQPILSNGMSPAQAILRGYNKDKVFSQQQAFKKRNGLKDDGSKAKWGIGWLDSLFGNDAPKKKTVHFYKSQATGKVFKTRQDAIAENNRYKTDLGYRRNINREREFEAAKNKSGNERIPYIKEKEIKLSKAGNLTGIKLTTNQLDSIAKYANRVGLPIKTALGLVGQESAFGNYFGYANDARFLNEYHKQGEMNRDIFGIPAYNIVNYERLLPNKIPTMVDDNAINHRYAKRGINKFGYPAIINDKELDRLKVEHEAYPGLARKRAQFWRDIKVPTLELAFKAYKEHPNLYNAGNPNQQNLVNSKANDVWGSPEIQEWYRTSPYVKHRLGGRCKLRNGGLTSKDRGSSKHPYPTVSSKDFAGGGRSYPIPTKADAVDALRLAGLHGRSDVKTKVYDKYPSLRKKARGGTVVEPYYDWARNTSSNLGISFIDPTYDYRVYYNSVTPYERNLVRFAPQGTHFTDIGKTPKHPTFSNESKYSNKKTPGGTWNGNVFVPSIWQFGNNGNTRRNRYMNNSGEGYFNGTVDVFPTYRKKHSLGGRSSRPVKGMRPKAAIGIYTPFNKRYTSIYDAPDYDDINGGNVLGNKEVTVTAKRIKPTFLKPNNDAMDIINHPANETPYIPQKHNRSRTIFSGGDYLGLGIDTLSALGTGLVNYNTAGKYVLPDRASVIQASKLPTTYNVAPEIEEVKRYRDRLTGETYRNTSSSVAALNRAGNINLDSLSNLSKLWATKENEENKMLTQDALNQQTVATQNVQNEIARQSEIARIENEANQAKGEALNVGLSGLSQAWTNFWTAGRTAYEDDQSRRAMIASSKEATPTRLMEMNFDLSPDLIASLYKTAKDDRTKRFYLSRLSPKQRQKYGIN